MQWLSDKSMRKPGHAHSKQKWHQTDVEVHLALSLLPQIASSMKIPLVTGMENMQYSCFYSPPST